jgi:hypothetical protein
VIHHTPKQLDNMPPGPWQGEPHVLRWRDATTGLVCLAMRNKHTGSFCGYVRVPHGHPFYRREYNGRIERRLRVHGGVTFSGGRWIDRGWWLGFDCAHAWDYPPLMAQFWSQTGSDEVVYRDLDFVKHECAMLAAQIFAVEGKQTKQGRQAGRRHDRKKLSERKQFMKRMRKPGAFDRLLARKIQEA